jgi:hypothetical protein
LKAESKKAEHHVSDSRATTPPSVCGEFIFNTLLIYIKDVQQQLRRLYGSVLEKRKAAGKYFRNAMREHMLDCVCVRMGKSTHEASKRKKEKNMMDVLSCRR